MRSRSCFTWVGMIVVAACGAAESRPGLNGDAEAMLLPAVRGVTFPADASDIVSLKVTVADPRGEAVRLYIEVSLDQGAQYRPARLASDVSALPSAVDGTEDLVLWESRKDVGFHEPRIARLRFVAEDSYGASAPYEIDTPIIDNLRAAAKHVQSYVISYATWDSAAIAFAKKHDLVIVHPREGKLYRPFIADLQAGADQDDPADDVLVLCYVSVGEDDRAASLSDAAARADARFIGDGTGPRIDPRGASPMTGSLAGILPQGNPSNGGTGWASYYLDDNSVFRSASQKGDGIPDRNAGFGGYFVNAGDPNWFDVVDGFRLDGPEGATGLREVLTASYGRALNCDGVFLDTIDTAAPNSFTDLTSPNLSKFEWTAPGFATFLARIHRAYPHRLLLQNRGLFFFDPRLPHFQFTTTGTIDFAFFESFRLDSNAAGYNQEFYADNRWNFAPKLMAEANRPNGFTVLSLGYAEGTMDPGAVNTLLGNGTAAYASLLEDIHVAQEITGFRHYLTNRSVTLVNSFVRDHSHWDDTTAPIWTSTYNDHASWPPTEATPRIGIQEVVPVPRGLTVRWDVALDMNRVSYVLYYQTTPFDFVADPKLALATHALLSPAKPAAYASGVGPTIYPYEATISGLDPNTTYHLILRARDASVLNNEEKNTVSLSARPLP